MSDQPASCFLPETNIQFAWDSTSLGYLKTCPRLYYYHMIEGWISREESVHLRFGIEIHNAFQDYDISRAAGLSHADSLHDVVRALLVRTKDFDPDHKTKTRDSLVRSVIWYLEKYKNDMGETHIIEGDKPAVEMSFRFELNWGPKTAPEQPYLLCGHLDKIVNINGDLFSKDYKTVWSFWNKTWEPDNQMTLYTIASKVILEAPVRGVVVDMLQVKEDVTEFKRDFTYRTPDQLQEWLKDLEYWLGLAEQYAVADYWPMNDTSCEKYGGCRFREICAKSPSVRERFLEGSFIKLSKEEIWNPLRIR